MSTNRANDLLLGSNGTATGLTGVNNASGSEVLSFTDPGLNYGSSTSGTFSHMVDFSAYGASGLDDIVWVSQDVTLTAGAVLHRDGRRVRRPRGRIGAIRRTTRRV